jgi:hypothetical protein
MLRRYYAAQGEPVQLDIEEIGGSQTAGH